MRADVDQPLKPLDVLVLVPELLLQHRDAVLKLEELLCKQTRGEDAHDNRAGGKRRAGVLLPEA